MTDHTSPHGCRALPFEPNTSVEPVLPAPAKVKGQHRDITFNIQNPVIHHMLKTLIPVSYLGVFSSCELGFFAVCYILKDKCASLWGSAFIYSAGNVRGPFKKKTTTLFQLTTLIYNSVFLATSAVICIKVADQKISDAGLAWTFRKWLKLLQGLSFMVIASNTSGQKCCYLWFLKITE